MSRHYINVVRWSLASRPLHIRCALRKVLAVNEPCSRRLQRQVKRSRA